MSLLIISRPITLIDANNKSKWNAAFEPIIYTGIRVDAAIINIYDSGGKAAINIQTLFPNEAVVGDTVYFKAGVYNQTATVTAVAGHSITTDAIFITAVGAGMLNYGSRKNYHVVMELYKILNNTYIKIADSVFRPLPNGTFTLDLKAILKRNIVFSNPNDYTTINSRDTNSSGAINFRTKEVWQGSSKSFSNFTDNDISYYVGAAKQLRDKYGSNMAAYVPMAANQGLYNGDFKIQYYPNSKWEITVVSSTMSINSQKKLSYFSSNAVASSTALNTKTILQKGSNYFIALFLSNMVKSRMRIKVGNTYSAYYSTNGLKYFNITDAGAPANVSLTIEFESTAGTGNHQGAVEFVRVYLENNNILAKFLMDDYEPTLFAGYPFDMSFIHSDNIKDAKVKRCREYYRSNKTFIALSLNSLNTQTNDFAVNRLTLDEDTIHAEAAYIDVSLIFDVPNSTGYATDYAPGYTKTGLQLVAQTNVAVAGG